MILCLLLLAMKKTHVLIMSSYFREKVSNVNKKNLILHLSFNDSICCSASEISEESYGQNSPSKYIQK